MADPRLALAQAMGVVASYTDQTGRRRRTPIATAIAMLQALGVPCETASQAAKTLAERHATEAARRLPRWIIVEPGTPVDHGAGGEAWTLTQEDGTPIEGRGPLPGQPLGLHALRIGNSICTMICAPDRLPLPRRAWGMTAPLYGMRSEAQGGFADYDDLTEAAHATAVAGATFLGLNPIHAGFWGDTGYSPYTPSHRRRLNVFHIATEGVPAGDTLIDYRAALPAKRRALEAAFAQAEGVPDPGFEAYLKAEGARLQRFALHQVLSDLHGPYWTDWPAALQNPGTAEALALAARHPREMRFHAWLQYRAAQGLAKAQAAMTAHGARGLYLDLAVGTHPAGAETWEDRGSFAQGISLGAPPDAFSREGQRWGLAPFNPEALIEDGFAPLAETIRGLFAHAGLVRIDHILGFDRAFWVPDAPLTRGLPGAYLRMPRDAMLAVVRLEAARAGGVVIGEDLGNVPRGLRGALATSGILGCRVAVFEQSGKPPRFRDPKTYPAASLASFSTHDLPTWKGWRAGTEIELRRALGHIPDAFAATEQTRRRTEVAAFDAMTAPHRPKGTAPDDRAALEHALAASGSALIAMQAEDVFGQTAQANLPGTVNEHPNWQRRLPTGAKDWHDAPELAATARILHKTGRGEPR